MTFRELFSGMPPGVGRRDAETLLLHVLGRDRAWLLAHPEADIALAAAAVFRALLLRRAAAEPIQYLTGRQEFFGLDLRVTPDVLIPRPETEHVVEAILASVQDQPQAHGLRLLDVGTGSGAIALALAANLPDAHVTALDISAAALAVARGNAERLGLAERVRLLQTDLLEALRPELEAGLRFDAIASNPPYVAERDRAELGPEVRDHEPPVALFAGEDGMDIYQRLLPQAASALRPGGLLAMEFGFGQQKLMDELFRAQPPGTWQSQEYLTDLQGIPRVVRVNRT